MPAATNPFPYFPEAGNNGFIYIGAANQDAQTNPVTVYRDAALTIPWAQPIRTVDGYPAFQGSSEGIFVGASSWSMTVKDSNGITFVNELNAYSFEGELASPTGAALVGFLQSGTGAVARTAQGKLRERIDLYDFAEGDGTTDDTAQINACLTAHTGKTIHLGGRTYIVTNLTIPSGTNIAGPGTIKRKTAATGFMVQGVSATSVQFDGATFDGNSTGAAVQLVRFEGASHDLQITNCTFKNATDSGLAVTGTSARATISGNKFLSNANYGFVIDATGGHHTVEGNLARLNGASGILLASDYSTVEGNRTLSNGQSITQHAGILLVNSDYCNVNDNTAIANGTGALFSHGIQLNTCAKCTMQGNISIGNNGSGLDAYISSGTVIDGNQSHTNGLRGIEIDSGSTYTTVTGNVVTGNAEVGISVFNTLGTTVDANTVEGNGTLGTATNTLIGAANSPYGIALWGAGNYGNFARVTNNMITANIGSGANGVGLYIHPSCVSVTLLGNTFTGNTSQATLVNANLAFAGQNVGLVFEQTGSATILSGSTSIAVTFSPALSFTPSAQDITLTYAQSPTTAPGEIYPASVTASGFTLNCRTNPGASNLTVGWRVRREAF